MCAAVAHIDHSNFQNLEEHAIGHTFVRSRAYFLITPRACARGKAIGFVCHLSVCCPHENRQIARSAWASEQLVSITKPSKSAKNWLHYASNRSARSTSVTNTVFLLTTPINCRPCAFCSCAQ